MRARLALAVSGVTCELREVVLRNKPRALLQASPKGTVPVLVDLSGTIIDESLDIMLWALRHHDPQAWLRHDPVTQTQVRTLIAQCDGPFKANLDRYKYPQRFPDADPLVCRDQAALWLHELNSHLEEHGWLVDGRISLADIAIAPFVRQFAKTNTAWFAAQSWPHLAAWLQAFLDSPIFERVMTRCEPWQEGTEGVLFGLNR